MQFDVFQHLKHLSTSHPFPFYHIRNLTSPQNHINLKKQTVYLPPLQNKLFITFLNINASNLLKVHTNSQPIHYLYRKYLYLFLLALLHFQYLQLLHRVYLFGRRKSHQNIVICYLITYRYRFIDDYLFFNFLVNKKRMNTRFSRTQHLHKIFGFVLSD